MPPTREDLTVLRLCRLVIALWELIVNKAQPYNVHDLVPVSETELNRRWRLWEAEHARLGLQAPRVRYRWEKNPPIYKMQGFPLRPKTTPVLELREHPHTSPRSGAGCTIPDNIPHIFRRAILMLRHCECSNFVMKTLLTRLLHTVNPSIHVEWFVVIPAPRFEIRLQGYDLPTFHSVLLITTPAGSQTVLDLTGEQFGIRPQDRISPLREYLWKYVAKPSDWSAARYTCNTDEAENMIKGRLDGDEANGDKFWKMAQRTVEGLFAGLEEQVREGRLGQEDWAGGREWMEKALAVELERL